jgi:hypothetical protein
MKRVLVTVDARTFERLRSQAGAERVTVGELIRRTIAADYVQHAPPDRRVASDR